MTVAQLGDWRRDVIAFPNTQRGTCLMTEPRARWTPSSCVSWAFASMADRWRVVLCVAMVTLLAGCSTDIWSRKQPEITAPVTTVAILPLERDEVAEARVAGEPRLPPNAEKVVTAQLYGVLTERSRWKVAPDLAVDDALRRLKGPSSLADRVRAVAKATKSDAVLWGKVSRFVERGGSEYGTREPAAVSFELKLLHASGDELWAGAFDETQQALSSNLLNWWMFWRAGPHWFAAHELARLGVEKLVDELERKLP